MKIYVAAMYSKKDYVRNAVHPVLVEAGYEPTARWVDQHAQDKISERDRAVMDLADVERADVLVLITNDFGTQYTGGGRMVEFGHALALGKHVFVVGDHECIFCHLPQVTVCSSIIVVVDQLNLLKPPSSTKQVLRDKIKDHLARPVLGRTPTPEEESLRFLTLALCGEAGELANLVKKDWRGDEGSKERRIKIADELADVANYTFMIATRLGVDLETLMLRKFEIVEKRLEWTRRRA